MTRDHSKKEGAFRWKLGYQVVNGYLSWLQDYESKIIQVSFAHHKLFRLGRLESKQQKQIMKQLISSLFRPSSCWPCKVVFISWAPQSKFEWAKIWRWRLDMGRCQLHLFISYPKKPNFQFSVCWGIWPEYSTKWLTPKNWWFKY